MLVKWQINHHPYPLFQFIELDKEAFDLETVSDCRYDSLAFYDGTESSNIWNLKYCGEQFPGTLTSTGNTVTLVFHSDSSVADTGFKISYRTVEVLPEEDSDHDDGKGTIYWRYMRVMAPK